MTDKDNRIRDEAYRLWVEAGRPDGQEQKHWLEAERRVAASGAGGAKAPKAPRAGKKRANAKGSAVAGPEDHLAEAKGPIAKVKEAFAKRRFDRAVKDVEAASSGSGATPAKRAVKARTAKPAAAKSAAAKPATAKPASAAKSPNSAAAAKTAKPRNATAVGKPAASKPKRPAAPAKSSPAATTAKAKI